MFNRIRRAFRSTPLTRRPNLVETLERRQLMHANVTNVFADNRGEVQITVSEAVTGVDKSSVRMTTSGPDAVPGTADDVRVPASVRLSGNKIIVRAAAGAVESNASYIVRLDAKKIRTADDGAGLDGEFTGTLPTGDGNSGGNFIFRTVRDRGQTPRVRMYTTEGVMTLTLRKDVAPGHATNFQNYMNDGRFDNVFFTRSENNPSPFVIQGGSLQITGTGTSASDIIATTRDSAVPDENDLPGALSNVLGTLAFAKSGPDDATNQFFINLANNSFLDSPLRSDGGFTVFAEVTGGLAVAQAINQLPVANLQPQIGTVAGSTNTGVSNVPVQNQAQAEAGLNPVRDLPYIRRTAQRMKLAAV